MRTLVDCGCQARVHTDESGVEIDYCPLHEAAEDMVALLRLFTQEASRLLAKLT